MSVASTWHIMFIIDTGSFPEWKYHGQHPGATPEEAIKKSQIDNKVAATRIRVYSSNEGTLYKRGTWVPWREGEDDE